MSTEILTSMLVLLAVLTFLYQTHPSLRESVTTDFSSGKLTIRIKNTGKGSAKIKSMQLSAYGISTIDNSDDDFVTKMAQPIDMNGNPDIEFNIWEKGDLVSPGEEILIFEAIIPSHENDLENTFNNLKKNITLTAKYRSIIGIPFQLRNRI